MLQNEVSPTPSLLLDCVELLSFLALLRAQWRSPLAETLAFELVVLRHVVNSFGLFALVGVGEANIRSL